MADVQVNKKESREYDSSWGYKRAVLGFDQLKQAEVVEIIMEKGQKTKAHYHTKVTEMFYVVSGEATILVEDEAKTLRQGDFLLLPPTKKHQIVANESGTLIVAVKTPGDEEDRIFLDEG
ncbi:MAG: cupin domain-containing protein [Archaeoglobaceae archaeon]|nr:cupin domain-containing protein [Archaeoglobaceae archaeon]